MLPIYSYIRDRWLNADGAPPFHIFHITSTEYVVSIDMLTLVLTPTVRWPKVRR